MATTVQPPDTAQQNVSTNKTTKGLPGVSPLRAGHGSEFWLRRLHSLSGIVPLGLFLIEHILISNSKLTQGPVAYAKTVEWLGSLPFVFFLELFGIWLPIAFHGFYGIYLWLRGRGNLVNYSWAGNWMYSLQRWTGMYAMIYILYHVTTKRFLGVDLHDTAGASFGKMQEIWENPLITFFYFSGLAAACWHFGYGIWLFLCKWGIIIGERARKRALVPCLGLAAVMFAVGSYSLYALTWWDKQPTDKEAAKELLHRTDEVPKKGQ